MTLYAIDKKSKILQLADYSDEDLALKNNKLILWRKTSYATKQTCPHTSNGRRKGSALSSKHK